MTPVAAAWLVQLYWLCLGLPGFALLRRLDPGALAGSGFRTLACSYLASCVLLSPFSIVGYVFQLPLWVLSAGTVLLVLLAIVELVRHSPALPKLALADLVLVVPALMLLADLVLAARVGSHLHGDAGYHVARARSLVDLGFNSWDPTLPGRRTDTAYHTNLYHALLASCAQLTRTHAVDAWLFSWPFAKLMTIAGAASVTHAVFGDRRLCWITACVVSLYYFPSPLQTYPNSLTAAWLTGLGLTFGVEVLSGEQRERAAAWLAASVLVTAQFHALYTVFLGLLLAPCLVAALVEAALRKRPGRRALVLGLLALGVGTPWLAPVALPKLDALLHPAPPAAAATPTLPAGRTPPPPAAAAPPAPPAAQAPTLSAAPAPPVVATELGQPDTHFVTLPGGSVMLNPRGVLDLDSRAVAFIACLGLGVFSTRRRQSLALAALMAVAHAYFYVPALCTALVHALGAGWILLRLQGLLAVACFGVFPAGLALHLLARWRHPLVYTAVLGASIAYGYHSGIDSKTFSRAAHLERAARGSALAASARLARQRKMFSHVAPGAVVLTMPGEEYTLPMSCNCTVMAVKPGRGTRGITDMAERRADAVRFFSGDSSLPEKLAILRRYGARYVLLWSKTAAKSRIGLFGKRVKRVDRARDQYLLTIETR